MSQEGGNNAFLEDHSPAGGPPSPDSMEPKKQSKLIRILTVVAYMMSVSMAAIFLSAYYVFMYDAQPTLAQKSYPISIPNALIQDHQGPIYHQYEQYVYTKDQRILKDKGLLASDMIHENDTDDIEDSVIHLENMKIPDNFSDTVDRLNNLGNMERSTEYEDNEKNSSFENIQPRSELSENNTQNTSVETDNKTTIEYETDSTVREHPPSSLLRQILHVDLQMPFLTEDRATKSEITTFQTVIDDQNVTDVDNNQ